MGITAVLIATAAVGGIGAVMGCLLGVAETQFSVKKDEKEAAVRELLPGSNCGGCGYPGCDGLAAAIAKGEAPCDQCPSCSAEITAKIAEVMGQAPGAAKEKKVAFVMCAGDCESAKKRYDYKGISKCSEVSLVLGGDKACAYGCLGYGECVSVCSFGAISIKNGIAVVDREKCTACGMCVKECPKHIIELVPYKKKYFVACYSNDKGKDVKASCGSGCIGCRLCAKSCPKEAIEITDNLAHISYDKCVGCGICAKKCPVGAIQKIV